MSLLTYLIDTSESSNEPEHLIAKAFNASHIKYERRGTSTDAKPNIFRLKKMLLRPNKNIELFLRQFF